MIGNTVVTFGCEILVQNFRKDLLFEVSLVPKEALLLSTQRVFLAAGLT